MSSFPAFGTEASVSPVAGFIVAMTLPSTAGCWRPPINSLKSRLRAAVISDFVGLVVISASAHYERLGHWAVRDIDQYRLGGMQSWAHPFERSCLHRGL